MLTRRRANVAASGARRVGAGLADQVVIALANAGNSLLALLLLDRSRAGGLILSITVGYVVYSLNRAFVGEVLLALAARYRDERRDRLVRDGLAAALAFGLFAAAVLIVVWGAAGLVTLPAGIDLRDLVWVAVVLPLVLLHDTARYTHLADREPDRALTIDLTYVLTQGLAVLILVLSGQVTAGGLVLCWGLGAAAGFTVFAVRTGHRPWRGDPRRWLAQTRFLSGWFTATAVVGQFHVLAVNFIIAGRLSKDAIAGFRLIQTTVLQPVQNLNQALMSMLVPRLSRLAGAADATGATDATDDESGSAAALRREVLRVATLLAALGVIVIAAGGLLAQWVLPLIPEYADTAPLAWPMLIQGAIYMVQAPFTSALRGMHRARLQFLQYVVFSVVSLTGLIIGVSRFGLIGGAWGLAIGSAIGLAVTIGLYLHAQRRL